MEKQKVVTISQRADLSNSQNPYKKLPNLSKRLKEFKISNLGEMQINNECFEDYYESLSILGMGAFGTVISAVDKMDGEIYAIKVNHSLDYQKR